MSEEYGTATLGEKHSTETPHESATAGTTDLEKETSGNVSVSTAELTTAVSDVIAALDTVSQLGSQFGGVWGSALVNFAQEARGKIPEPPPLPKMSSLTPRQRFEAIGSLAEVRFAKNPGRYLILAVDEEAECVTVAQAATATLLTPHFGMVAVDLDSRIFSAEALVTEQCPSD